jgi:hypothetical protein
MSKEREILKKILMLYREDKSCMNWGTANEIQELLAQPEQEPVAWMYEWDTTTTGQPTCKYVNMGKDKPNVEANFLARNFIPLYTVPQNQDLREALREALREEPVGIVITIGGYPDDSEHTVKLTCRHRDLKDGDLLYRAPPKREPLTDEEVRAKYRDIALDNPLYVPSYYAGFRDAEQAHGITGGV